MDNIAEQKCPACGAPLVFKPESGLLECEFCGSAFTIEHIEDSLKEEAAAGQQPAETGNEEFDWGSFKDQLEDEQMEIAVYNCNSCGAEIMAEPTTAAMRCPYCDNNIVLNERIKGGLKPNGVIPFKIDPKSLPDAIKRFYGNKPLLPRDFFSANKLGNVQGVYVPFWMYNCRVDGSMEMRGTTVRHYTQGQYNCTETSYFQLDREGGMAFERIPVDGSEKMPDDLMDSIEPFDYSELVPFDHRYLAGYVADRFDYDPDDCLPRATNRVMNSADEVFRSTAAEFGDVQVTHRNLNLHDTAVKYVMLPVYLFTCKYGGKDYRYAVNGQTGKVVGDLPISKGKTLAWFFGTFAAVAAVVATFLYLL